MRKNRMMRAASALLVAVLMTTCTISGTFAKYVTEVKASDNARVARWGFGETSTIDFDLFDASYDDSVVASNSDNLIAPGTTKTEMVKLNYAGVGGATAPEVDYKIDLNVVSAETSIADDIKNNSNIKWSFNNTGWVDWDTMITAIEAYTEDVEANALPAIANTGIEIKWKWAFDAEDDIPFAAEDKDTLDTSMGDKVSLDTVKLTIALVATQKD